MSLCITTVPVLAPCAVRGRGLSRRRRAGVTSRVVQTRASSQKTDPGFAEDKSAVPLGRRAALLLSVSLAVFVPPTLTLPAFADTNTSSSVRFEPIPNERWSAVEITTHVPSSWQTRPGQRTKQSKFMMYTDSYGPNYRYTTLLAKFVDTDGVVTANMISLQVQSRGGQDSITDLGPIANIDAAKAFGIDTEDIALAEVVSSNKRNDAKKQSYYEWELLCPTGTRVLISACISGGGLYVLSVEATVAQWEKNADALRNTVENFAVPVVAESTLDVSNRIYNSASDAGFQ